MKTTNFIAKITRKIGDSLMTSDREPQVKQKRDRDGYRYWQAHDPQTNRFYTFSSEKDVRVWIENRYHSNRRF